jgi:hypothetical protein
VDKNYKPLIDFVKKLAYDHIEGVYYDGGELQELMIEHGLLKMEDEDTIAATPYLETLE